MPTLSISGQTSRWVSHHLVAIESLKQRPAMNASEVGSTTCSTQAYAMAQDCLASVLELEIDRQIVGIDELWWESGLSGF